MISTQDGNTNGEGRQTVLIRSMPSDLWHECKAAALRNKQTLREFVIDALGSAITRRKR